MRSIPFLAFLCAALAPTEAFAQAAEPRRDFGALWTRWGGANREAMRTESEALARLRAEVAAADAARLRQLQARGRDLGERVGEVVRLGDCADGERIAREAGDFALVEAVRAHCAGADGRSAGAAR